VKVLATAGCNSFSSIVIEQNLDRLRGRNRVCGLRCHRSTPDYIAFAVKVHTSPIDASDVRTSTSSKEVGILVEI
jgi:hypothetical protein